MPLPIYQKNQPTPFTIAIAAGKGGVGKSSTTVNLALTLQTLGFSVGIMDTDLYGPSIRKMLPEEQAPTQRGPTIFPAICGGIKMISMAYFRKPDEAAAVRAPIANNFITQFIQNVEWGHLDFLLIDFPPGTGDIQLTLAQKANLKGAVMVTTPQEVALIDVRRAMHLFAQVQIPILGIVENMSYYTSPGTQEKAYLFGKEGGKRLATSAHVPFLGEIPLNPKICQSGDLGLSLFKAGDEDSKDAVRHFQIIAANLISQINLTKEDPESHDFELVWKK